METQENKIIRDKINALNGFPEGYQVNMESKWTLLEAGLENNRKKTVFSWKWVAAVFVLFASVAVWFMLEKQKSETKQFAGKIKSEERPSVHFPLATLNIVSVKEQMQRKDYAHREKVFAVQHPDTATTKETLDPTTAKDQPVLENNEPALEQVAEKSEPKAEALSKTKQRFVECDFTDGLPPGTTYSQSASAPRGLKFKLGNGRISNTTVQNNSKRFAIRRPL